ncbi:MAG: hypothetical protein GY795_18795 [Desulfobacterales bacterium]|nr:hypothetical protein [Desulfobacterales bacterium]
MKSSVGTDVYSRYPEKIHKAPLGTESLANLVKDKTGGNPFFMNEFLKSLHSEKLICFDTVKRVWHSNTVQA